MTEVIRIIHVDCITESKQLTIDHDRVRSVHITALSVRII